MIQVDWLARLRGMMFTKLKITAVIVNANPQVAGVAIMYLQALKTDKYSGNS